jgi:hypothetical protein
VGVDDPQGLGGSDEAAYAAERRFNVSPAEAAGGVVGQKGGRRGGEAQGGGEAQAHTPLD